MAAQVVLFFFMEDIWHYFTHQAMHYGPLYKHIHKIHHKYSAPFGLAAEYAHPIEVLLLGIGSVGSPLLYCALSGNLHIATVYIFITLRLFQAVDAHSGYGACFPLFRTYALCLRFSSDFPWSLQHWFPLWAGAEHHDYHHMAFMDNFSSSFRYLDFIFGTDERYKSHKAKLQKMRDAAKQRGASEKEYAEIEQRLNEESEAIGTAAEVVAEQKKLW